MNYIGKWRFHSIGVINESGELIYLSAEEYLNSPMPYIDETDEDAVADEMRERKQITSSLIEICDNGKLLMLIPISKEEYESYLAELESGGEKELRPGMICIAINFIKSYFRVMTNHKICVIIINDYVQKCLR